jgi:membrane protease YdiL (CAAX protease family)
LGAIISPRNGTGQRIFAAPGQLDAAVDTFTIAVYFKLQSMRRATVKRLERRYAAIGVAASHSSVTPRDPWRFGAVWTIFFLAFPVAFTGLVFRAVAASGIGLAPLQPVVASFVVYAVIACGLAVLGVWLWAQSRGLVEAIFAFRRPGGRDWLIGIGGCIAGFAIFAVTQWLARRLLGASMKGMRFDLQATHALPAMVLAVVIAAPFCEEVLFRGLGVAYLRARGWPSWSIVAAMALAFAAIHLPHFGMAGAISILFWGGMVTAIRLWTDSLTPGLLLHAFNNTAAYILMPLLITARPS